MTFWEIFGVWFATAMTLFILSFLYKDNPFYKLAENIFVGISLGYSVVTAIWKVIYPDWFLPLIGSDLGILSKGFLLIPGVLGILTLSRVVPKFSWLSRPAFAFVMGWAAGVAIPTAVDAFVLKHTSKTVSAILPGGDFTFGAVFSAFTNLLIVVIVLCVLVYFFFSIEHRGPVRVVSRLGVLFLMIAFGIAYGNTVMGRMALLYNRFFELKQNASGDSYYATPILVVLTVLGLILHEVWIKQKPPGIEGVEFEKPPEGSPT